MLDPSQLADLVIKVLAEKKALDIKLLRTADVTILADFFVICTAGSTTHLKTLSDSLEVELKKSGEKLLRREGEKNSQWVLLDYGSVVVHVFLTAGREFYKLEHLWSDAEDVDISTRLGLFPAEGNKD